MTRISFYKNNKLLGGRLIPEMSDLSPSVLFGGMFHKFKGNRFVLDPSGRNTGRLDVKISVRKDKIYYYYRVIGKKKWNRMGFFNHTIDLKRSLHDELQNREVLDQDGGRGLSQGPS